MSTILGIESTCDETAASVVVDGVRVLSSVIASQVDLHEKYRGVVPEIASRAHIENILPVLREALSNASVSLNDIDAIAVAHRPGLIGSLLVGVTAAKTLAWSTNKPLIAVDHVHAHLYSVNLAPLAVLRTLGGAQPADSDSAVEPLPSLPLSTGGGAMPELPAIGMVCSGGHTALYNVKRWSDVELIGSTIDDAVGEAYDKVAGILGLSYPGGPIIDRLAREGSADAVRFPRSMLGRESLDFSFSGLKTAVLYHVRGVPGRDQKRTTPLEEHELRDVCASFQAACIDTIVKKIRRALKQHPARSIIIGGGVSANAGLRAAMKQFDRPTFFPPLAYCTDNAAMSAGLAHLLFEQKQFAELDLDAVTFSQFRR